MIYKAYVRGGRIQEISETEVGGQSFNDYLSTMGGIILTGSHMMHWALIKFGYLKTYAGETCWIEADSMFEAVEIATEIMFFAVKPK